MTLISDSPRQHPQNQVEHEERADDDEWDEVEPVPGVPWGIVGLQWDRSNESRSWEGTEVQREINIRRTWRRPNLHRYLLNPLSFTSSPCNNLFNTFTITHPYLYSHNPSYCPSNCFLQRSLGLCKGKKMWNAIYWSSLCKEDSFRLVSDTDRVSLWFTSIYNTGPYTKCLWGMLREDFS